MAVTIKQQPESYTPVYNEQVFVALSSQVAQPNFEYTVKVTDIISGVTKTYPVPPRPDDYCVFDAREFAQSYFDPDHHSIPMNTYGWNECAGTRKVRVNIGETYGSTPAYTAGSNIDYIVWNGIEGYKDFPNYDPENYVYKRSTENIVYLSKTFDDVTYPDRSNYLYVLTSEAGDLLKITVTTYDESGSPLGSSDIANPNQASTDYREKYLCIDVGHKGLSEIDAGAVSGTYPIITDDVASYDITQTVVMGGPPASTVTPVRAYTVGCEPRFDVYTVHFLSKSGAFETIHFSKRSDTVRKTVKSTFRRDPHVFDDSAETYTYSPSTPQEFVQSVMETETLKLSTNWLSQDQADLYAQIISTGYAYLDLGSDTDYLALKVLTDSYTLRKAQNDKLYQIIIDFELSHANGMQV